MSMDVSDVSKTLQRFSWPDYLVFSIMLVVCLYIGVYFGWQDHKKHKNKRHSLRRGSEALDYLVGGRKMAVFPVAMSLVASFISGISLLGTSTEIYIYGTQYCYIYISVVITGVVLHYVYLPVYHDLRLTSTYEYLRLRFDNKVRLFGSILFLVNTMLWLPIVCYVPALAAEQVSGINLHIVTPAVCIICIFYTCVGGIKAVVWTDVIQTFVMVGGMLIVIFKGTYDVGGFQNVLEKNWESGRIEPPNLSWDPTVRLTFWSVLIGGTVHNVGINAAQQAQIQRFFSLNTLKKARISLWFFIVGVLCIKTMSVYNGMLAYATYHDCDPLTTKLAKAKDQLVPVLVMKVLGDYPGLPGMFIAGVFSAALSSLSTGLNSLVAVTLEDFIKPVWTDLSEKRTAWIMRILVLVYGFASVALVFVVEKLGTSVLALSASLSGTSIGPLLALFTLGLFFPWSALIGSVLSFLAMACVAYRAQTEIAGGYVDPSVKPTSTDGCTYTFDNSSLTTTPMPPNSTTSSKQLTLYYYSLFGLVGAILIANIISLLFERNHEEKYVDARLIAPQIRKYFKAKSVSTELNGYGKAEIVHTFEQINQKVVAGTEQDKDGQDKNE